MSTPRPKKKKQQKRSAENPSNAQIRISHIQNSTLNVAGRDQTVQTTRIDVDQAFQNIFRMIDALPASQEKASAYEAVQGLEMEAKKEEAGDGEKVKKWLKKLADIAPDIFDVTIKTLLNPVEGISLVFRKVVEKASKTIEN